MALRGATLAYAEEVWQQANGPHVDPLYTGDHLKDIAMYIRRATRSDRTERKYSPQANRSFLWLYNLRRDLEPKVFAEAKVYEDSIARGEISYQAGVVFLTGHPTPEWLATLGGEYKIPTPVLMNHMSFLPSVRWPTYMSPVTEASNGSVIRFNVPTIGHVDPPPAAFRSKDLQQLRHKCATKIKEGLKSTANGRIAGTPIVRRFCIHDEGRFTIEQEISITLVQEKNRWTLLIFCDAGSTDDPELVLQHFPEYEKRDFILVPIIQESRSGAKAAQVLTNAEKLDSSGPHQTLAHIAAHYGTTLDRELATEDPFYALHELFELVASAESQFINMMYSLVTAQIELQGEAQIDVVGHERQGTPMLADFHHSRDVLDHHILRLKETVGLLKERDKLQWPQSSRQDLRKLAGKSRDELHYRFNALLQRAESLVDRCERGADLALNNASLQMAERSFAYSRSIGTLSTIGTWLAVLFVPLSLVTSIFGMSFKELGSLSMWTYAAVAVPVVLISLAALFWQRAWRFLERWMERE